LLDLALCARRAQARRAVEWKVSAELDAEISAATKTSDPTGLNPR
jgi:hypothetical protein